ncbi:uncharacterized protein [Battus philenor]|uniref:uncharacterized protein isoform X2 n=1 Tax=Battus philenor TaxID=42288 RepID=UPI0035CF9C9A
MAEACRLGTQIDRKTATNDDEYFCVFNVLSVFISLITILADLTTDILVFAEYCKDGYLYWALATFIFMLSPNVLINIFSIRWFVIDNKSTIKHWITHGCLVGLLERYIIFLRKVFTCKNLESIKTQKLISQRNDLSLLHYLYIFTGTIPQIILQSYAILMLNENYHTKVLHWIAMTLWIVVQRTAFCPNKLEETLYNIVMGFVYCFSFINLRGGPTRYRLMMFYTLMVTQNFGSLFLYVLLTDFEKQKKPWSIVATICIIAGTMFGMFAMVLYYRYFHSKGPIPWKYAMTDIELNNKIVVQAPNNSNICSTLCHVRSFKSLTSDKPNEAFRKDPPISQHVSQIDNEQADKKFLLDHWIARSGSPTFTSAPVGNTSSDGSSIEIYSIENTLQNSTTKRDNFKLETISSKVNKKILFGPPKDLTLQVRSSENIENSIDEITSIFFTLNLQKRRGVCSSEELRKELNNLNLEACDSVNEEFPKTIKTDRSSEISHDTDGSNKKTSSDSFDMDLDLSISDINSSDINTFNENIVQKLCLSALKNIKVGNQDADIENIQRIALDILKEMYTKKDRKKSGIGSEFLNNKQRDLDTPTEILSVHDYENICAVNIAREAWGLRSWNGYCDIENWLHDGSVVRDRSRDTLTSGSSEISSCISQDLKHAILSAPPFPKKAHTYSNVFVKFDRSSQGDYANTVVCHSNDESFLAKPCMIENIKDPNHLEPILEELDDLGDIDPACKKRLNSESSLVATIDEIRKSTVTNSPRNLYHRREQVLDSPKLYTSKNECTLKKTLWKEASIFDPSNIMKSLPEKENILDELHEYKLDFNNKELNLMSSNSSLNSQASYSKSPQRRSKSNITKFKSNSKSNNNKCEQLDLSSKNIDFLWQMVSENAMPLNSNEDLSLCRKTPSLQSLIHRDTSSSFVNTSTTKISNIKKSVRNRPRRKFSLLRERFEPKLNLHSDEEILYNSENTLHQHDSILRNPKHLSNENIGVTPKKLQNACSQESKFVSSENLSDFPSKHMKEKRSLFMKQVLSPPKFNTKLRQSVAKN